MTLAKWAGKNLLTKLEWMLGHDVSEVDLGFLSGLNKLEELYLPDDVLISDLSWLPSLTSLQDMQIPPADVSFVSGDRYSDCPGLESIVFLGLSDRLTISDLMGLPILESLSVIDVHGESLGEFGFSPEKVKALLPGVSVEFIAEDKLDGYKPEIPDTLKSILSDPKPRRAKSCLVTVGEAQGN